MAGEVGAGLQELLIEVGCLDLGDHLTGPDARADVGAPALQVTRYARENRCAGIGFQPARQIEVGMEGLGVG
ncbi:hypothetical protein ACVWW7_006146 [Bradyrhizobium sp. LM6.9]